MNRILHNETFQRVVAFFQKRSGAILLILLAAAVIPFFLLTYYAHPSADDFCYGWKLKAGTFWGNVKGEYLGWKGRYTAIVLTVAYHKAGPMLVTYQFALLAFLTTLFVALYVFTWSFLEGRASRLQVLLLTLALGALYLGTMPLVPATLYWIDGAFQYQSGAIFTLLSLAALLALYRSGSAWWALAACLCIFLAVGATEIAMLTVTAVAGVMAFNRFVIAGRDRLLWTAVVVVTMISSALLLLAPGNYVRAQYSLPEARQFWYAFSHAWFYGGQTIAGWFASPALWLATACFIPVALRLTHLKGVRGDASWARLALTGGLLLGLVWLYFFAMWWSVARNPPGRMFNLIYLLFLAGWFSFVLECVAVMARRTIVFVDEVFPAPLRTANLIFIALFCGFLLLQGQGASAILDLAGRAPAFDRVMQDRYAMIDAALRESGRGRVDLVLPRVVFRPRVLMYSDIQLDRDDWRNSCYARYFGLKSVVRR